MTPPQKFAEKPVLHGRYLINATTASGMTGPGAPPPVYEDVTVTEISPSGCNLKTDKYGWFAVDDFVNHVLEKLVA